MLYARYESQHTLWASGIPNAHSHIVKNLMILSLADDDFLSRNMSF